jgi:hypothetical protein
MSEHATALEPKIRALGDQLTSITSENFSQTLLTIIHRPGWTTPQEAELVHAMIDALTHQLDGVGRAQRALVAAAEKIGRS